LQIKKHKINPSKKYTAAVPVSGRRTRTFVLTISFRFNPRTEADPAEKRSSKGPPLKGPAPRREPLIKGGRRSSGGGSWEASGEEAKEESREENARLKGRRRRGNAARLVFLLEGRRLLATTIGMDERTTVAMAVLWRGKRENIGVGREIFENIYFGSDISRYTGRRACNTYCVVFYINAVKYIKIVNFIYGRLRSV
jgi:hypothetical protein